MSTLTAPTAPAWWIKFPDALKTNDWLLQDQKSALVAKIEGTISQIHSDIELRTEGMLPMQATREYYGDISVNATKHSYKQLIAAVDAYTGMDAAKAQEVLAQFNEHYKEYLPYLA